MLFRKSTRKTKINEFRFHDPSSRLKMIWNDESKIEKETYEKTALNVAIEKGNIDIVKLLLSNPKIDINIVSNEYNYFSGNREILKEKYAKTALFKAVEKENVEIVKLLLERPEININFKEYYERMWYFQSYDIEYESTYYFLWEDFQAKKILLHK